MRNYLELAKKVLDEGRLEPNRTGIDALSIFGYMLEFDLRKGFPLVSSRKTGLYDVGKELFMFLNGITDATWLSKLGCNIWGEWGYSGNNPDIPQGSLGPVYGKMWRAWPGKVTGMRNVQPVSKTSEHLHFTGEPIREEIDQIRLIDEQLRKHSKSRRLINTAWNVEYLPDEGKSHNENIEAGKQVLPPCHTFFQMRVYSMTIDEIYQENEIATRIRHLIAHEMEDCYLNSADERRNFVIDRLKEAGFANLKTSYLSMIMYARSQDLPLGTPYNISSYALFLELWANSHDMVAKDLKIAMGDVHIYTNQIELMREQIKRDPRPLPKLVIAPEAKDFLNVDITKVDIKSLYHLEGYDPHPAIRYPSPAV